MYRHPREEKMQRENYLMRSFINLHVISIDPCIVIYSYSTTNKMHLLCQIIYSCKTLYMFRTVFPSIIRSSKTAYTATVCVKQLLLSGMRWNCTSSHPRQQQLFDTYRCCICSFELLMMERPSETCRAFYKNK